MMRGASKAQSSYCDGGLETLQHSFQLGLTRQAARGAVDSVGAVPVDSVFDEIWHLFLRLRPMYEIPRSGKPHESTLEEHAIVHRASSGGRQDYSAELVERHLEHRTQKS